MGEEGGAEAKRWPLLALRLQVTDHLQRIAAVHLRQLGKQPAQHRYVVSTESREFNFVNSLLSILMSLEGSDITILKQVG